MASVAESPVPGDSCWGYRSRGGLKENCSLACNMTGGSSGGGWITGGKLNSVTSFGYTGLKNVLYGPFFGSVIQTAYTSASNTP